MIYGVAGALSKGISIVLTPLYTRMLSVSQFGMLDIALNTLNGLAVVGGLQSESSLARDYFEGTEKERRILAGAVTIVTFVSCAIVTVAYIACALFGKDNPNISPSAVVSVGLCVLPSQALALKQLEVRLSGNPKLFSAISVADVTLSGALGVALIRLLKDPVQAVLSGNIIAKLLCLLLLYYKGYYSAGLALRHHTWDVYKKILTYCIPLLPATVLSWSLVAGHRQLLAYDGNTFDLAMTAMSFKVAGLLGLLTVAFRNAWEPISLKAAVEEDNPSAYYRDALRRYALVSGVLINLVILASPILTLILGSETFLPSVGITPFLVSGQILIGAVGVVGIGITLARKNGALVWVNALGVIVMLLTYVLLSGLPRSQSGALAYFGGVAVISVAITQFANHLGVVKFQSNVMMSLIIILAGTSGAISYINPWKTPNASLSAGLSDWALWAIPVTITSTSIVLAAFRKR